MESLLKEVEVPAGLSKIATAVGRGFSNKRFISYI
jgi:hypothetical protein